MKTATLEINKLQARLRSLTFEPGQIKTAGSGDSPDQPFEVAFSNLAHAIARDKRPGLEQYEVGFQLISRNEDNTKAVGVIGYKLGESQWIYAPVFFLNGQLKGGELLYLKNQDQFIPSEEEWIDYLLGRKPQILGESVDRNLSRIGVQPPNLYQLSRSPHKFASAVPKMASWARAAMPYLAKIATTDPATLAVVDLPTFLVQEGRPAFQAFLKTAAQYPGIVEGFDKLYGAEKLIEIAQTIAANEVKSGSIMRTKVAEDAFDRLAKRAFNTGSVMREKTAAKTKGVKHVTLEEVSVKGRTDLIQDLSAAEKERLLREKIVFTDSRDDKDVTLAYNVQTPLKLLTPDQTGIYEVLVRPDKFETCLVLMSPYNERRRQPFATVVRLNEPRNWTNTHASNLCVTGQLMIDGWDKWFEDLKDAGLPDGDSDDTFIVLGPSGQATTPFTVREKFEGGDEIDDYKVYFDDYAKGRSPGYLPDHFHQDDYEEGFCCSSSRSHIVFDAHEGTELRIAFDGVHIPKGFKVMRVKKHADDDEGKENPAVNPGNLGDAQMLVMGNTKQLKVTSGGNQVTIDGSKRIDKQAALIYLVEERGLREKTARYILDEADRKQHFTCRLYKQAGLGETPGDMISGAPNAPGFPEPNIGYDPMTGGNIPTQELYESQQPIADMSASRTDRSLYLPMGPDPQTMGVAQQAGQTGQKEVFDTAMLGSLLKIVRHDSMVDRYMPDLMKGLDRLGRILFLFYWHGEEFEDQYGKQDMPELEDGLRAAFEAAGSITMALKKKTVEASPEEGMHTSLKDLANN